VRERVSKNGIAMHERPPVILFVSHWAAQLGGAEYSLLDIIEYMGREANVHLLTSEKGALSTAARRIGAVCHEVTNPGEIRGQYVRKNLPAALLFALPRCAGYLLFLWRSLKVIRKIDPDCIHANVPRSHIATLLLAPFLSSTPLVLHMREIFDAHSLPYSLYRILVRSRRVRVIAISRAVHAALPRRARECGTVIYNGVDCSVAPVSRKRDDDVACVYLGRIVPWKGIDDLVDILGKVRALCPALPVSLALVGPTRYWDKRFRREVEERIGRAKLTSRCSLQESTDTPLALLAHQDIFLCGSVNEPFGRSVAEAQACSLPVVGWRSGGVREIVVDGETGLLVTPGDKEAFARAIISLAQDRERRETMGHRGRLRAQKLFNRLHQLPATGAAILAAASKGEPGGFRVQ